MDEEEFNIANQEFFGPTDDMDQLQNSCWMDSLIDDIFEDTTHACTHTHTCNPPGPDLSHTHTCFHVHTKIVSAPTDETADCTDKKNPSNKGPCGNKASVKKYREKRKAYVAALEEENLELRAESEILKKRLQSLLPLESENMRLKCLLVDLRGRIDSEIGAFPYHKSLTKDGVELGSNLSQVNIPGAAAHILDSCNLRCDDAVYCSHPRTLGKSAVDDDGAKTQGFGVCELGISPCLGNAVNGSKDNMGCDRSTSMPGSCASSASEKKRTRSNPK